MHPDNINDLLKFNPLLFDGGMGTEIQKKGLKDLSSPDVMNLEYPGILVEIHQGYITAGSKVISTNTFGANRKRLKEDYKRRVEEINLAAVRIANEAAGNNAFVAGDVGPTGAVLEPFGDLSAEEAEDVFSEQISAMLSAGLKFILIETMMSLEEALCALRAAKKLKAPVTGVSMTLNIAGDVINTPFGENIEQICSLLISNGADFIGSNCGNGFDNMLVIGRKMKDFSTVPVLVQPNAGLPVLENDKLVYKESPAEFAKFVQQAAGYGIEMIGGCCGTSNLHISAAHESLKTSGLV